MSRISKRYPQLREQMRPAELVGLAAILGIFVGVVIAFTTRSIPNAVIIGGVAFIVSVVMMSLLVMTVDFRQSRPDAEKAEPEEKQAEADPEASPPRTQQ